MGNIAIIGGGASGLVAAIEAARGGANVVIFESADRVGKKIMATGNGRCNLSNTDIMSSDYNRPEFVQEAMNALMDKHGKSKTMYPGTNEHGESVYISIFEDMIVTMTTQSNGWMRKNIYYRDGSREETFER